MRTKNLILMISLLWSAPALAGVFKVDSSLTAMQKSAVDNYLKEVEAVLPATLKHSLRSPIKVRFVKMGSTLNPPSCRGENSEKKLSYFARHILGGSDKNLSVEMNRLFLDVLVAGEEKAQGYNCGHKNMYRLAQATLIHEVAHIYDLRTEKSYTGAYANEYAKYSTLCLDVEYSRDIAECRHYRQFKGRISDSRPYLATIGWSFENGYIKQRGAESARTPDPYEYQDQREHFAVNMEFFLLDPEYKCRRPVLYDFFAKQFGAEPFANASCQIETQVNYSFSPESISLNPERVYQIHYFLAGKGTSTESKFGHSMFRIVGCAPGRAVGPDCLKDFKYHHIVSFRANVMDMIQSNLKGLSGGYPSQLFLYPLYEMITEYTMGESREIFSYPLKLNQEQKQKFLARVLELYWQYSSGYYFLSNNCATESRYLMQSVLPEIQMIKQGVVTPFGLAEQLKDLGLLDQAPLKDSSANGVYYFPSFETQMQTLLKKLQGIVGNQRDISFDSMAKMKTQDRKNLTAEFLSLYPQRKSLVVGTMLGIEMKMKDRELAKVREKMGEIFNEALDGKYPEIKKVMDETRDVRISLQPWKMTTQGYGIAKASDRVADKVVHENQLQTLRLGDAAARMVEETIPQEYQESRSILATIQEYLGMLK